MAKTYEKNGTKYVSSAWHDIEMRILKKEIRKISDGNISPVDLSDGMDSQIRMGLNWAAIGETTVEDATRFAESMTKAARLVSEYKYNGYTIDYEMSFDKLPENEQEEIRAIIKANRS